MNGIEKTVIFMSVLMLFISALALIAVHIYWHPILTDPLFVTCLVAFPAMVLGLQRLLRRKVTS